MITTSTLPAARKQIRTDRLIAALSKIPSKFGLTLTCRKIPIRPKWNTEDLSRAELARLLKYGAWMEHGDRKLKQEYDGIALIIPSGYVVADIDGQTAHRLFCEISGQKQPDKTVAWSSGKPNRGALLYRLPFTLAARMDALKRQLSKIRLTECSTWKTQGGDAIELLLSGSRATIPPSSHPETAGYEFKLGWDYGIQTAPAWVVQAIEVEVAKREYWATQPKQQFTGKVERQDIEQWLSAVRPDTLDYDSWIKVGMAIKSAFSDEDGLELWDDWSQLGSSYQPRECERRWDGFTAGRVTVAYLANLAGFEFRAIGAGVGFAKPNPKQTEAQKQRDRLIAKRMMIYRSNYKAIVDKSLYLSKTPADETTWYQGYKLGDPLIPRLCAYSVFIRGGLGSGKTEAMLGEVAIDCDRNQYIWLTLRLDTMTQTVVRAKKMGIDCYVFQQDVGLYRQMLRSGQPGLYFFCLEGLSAYHTEHIDWSIGTVIVDEFSALRADAPGGKAEIFEEFQRCIAEAGRFVAIDANLSDIDAHIISALRPGKRQHFYRQIEIKSAEKINWIECRNKTGELSLSHDGIAYGWLEKRIKAGERYAIASDTKTGLKAAKLHDELLGSNIDLATSETIEFCAKFAPDPDAYLRTNPNANLGYSPKIQNGADIQERFA